MHVYSKCKCVSMLIVHMSDAVTGVSLFGVGSRGQRSGPSEPQYGRLVPLW